MWKDFVYCKNKYNCGNFTFRNFKENIGLANYVVPHI